MIYDTAIPAYNDRPEPAVAFVKFLSEPNKKGFWKAAGFELMPVIELISDHLAGRPRMSALGHRSHWLLHTAVDALQVERAIERSGKAPLVIEAAAQHPSDELREPMTRLRRSS